VGSVIGNREQMRIVLEPAEKRSLSRASSVCVGPHVPTDEAQRVAQRINLVFAQAGQPDAVDRDGVLDQRLSDPLAFG